MRRCEAASTPCRSLRWEGEAGTGKAYQHLWWKEAGGEVWRSIPEVAEVTQWLERSPLGYGAEPVRSGKGGTEGLRGREWNGAKRNTRADPTHKTGLSKKGLCIVEWTMHIMYTIHPHYSCGRRSLQAGGFEGAALWAERAELRRRQAKQFRIGGCWGVGSCPGAERRAGG